jgi:signal transduction histidine kinase
MTPADTPPASETARRQLEDLLCRLQTAPEAPLPQEVAAIITSVLTVLPLDIIERKRAEEALREHARQFETVRAVAEEITWEMDLHQLLDLITRRAVELVAADSGGVHLWDEAEQALVPQVTTGMSTAPWQAKIRYRLGEGVVGIVAQRHEGLIVNDYRAWAGARSPVLAHTAIVASLAEPLLYRDKLIGVINLSNTPRRGGFAEHHGVLLRLFADQAAIAIDNARLYQALDQSFQDLQRVQEELLRTEKLRALGTLAAGIAHDLNNMLATVLGQIELLKIRVSYPEVHEALATMETAATDGAEIVRRIQDFSRQRVATRLDPCRLARIVEEAVEITRPRWKDEAERHGVSIALHTAVEDLPEILGHPAEIREALTNLVFNAVDAMPAGGEIEIRGTADEESVLLSVRDTGHGMPEAIRSRVFEPFFTTKGSGEPGWACPSSTASWSGMGGGSTCARHRARAPRSR